MTQTRMIIMIRVGRINFNLDEFHRWKNVCNFVDTQIERSNIQNKVIQDEITRNENENS
jgi:hypothetical protein